MPASKARGPSWIKRYRQVGHANPDRRRLLETRIAFCRKSDGSGMRYCTSSRRLQLESLGHKGLSKFDSDTKDMEASHAKEIDTIKLCCFLNCRYVTLCVFMHRSHTYIYIYTTCALYTCTRVWSACFWRRPSSELTSKKIRVRKVWYPSMHLRSVQSIWFVSITCTTVSKRLHAAPPYQGCRQVAILASGSADRSAFDTQCLWRLKLLSQALFREIEVANRDWVKLGIRLRFSCKYVCLSF